MKEWIIRNTSKKESANTLTHPAASNERNFVAAENSEI